MWPDVPASYCRNADGGEERERERPRPTAQAPPRTDQGAWRVHNRVYFPAFSEDVCKDVGEPEPDFAPGPAAVPPGPPLVRLPLRVDGAQSLCFI